MIREASQYLRESLVIPDDFKMSNRWVDRFRHRHLLKKHKLHGESSSADQGGAMSFLQKVQSKLEKYHPKDIYNMDVTAVLYRAPPDLRFPGMHLLD